MNLKAAFVSLIEFVNEVMVAGVGSPDEKHRQGAAVPEDLPLENR